MKIKNISLMNIVNTLNKYANTRLPQKISYAITKNMMLLGDDVDVYNKQIKLLFDSYDEYIIKDEDGKVQRNQMGIPVVEESVKESFYGELNDFFNIEIDVNLYTISEEAFEYDDKEKRYDPLTPNDIIVLQSIICKSVDEGGDTEDAKVE